LDNNWSGKTEGWGFGIRIFFFLIRVFGFSPAYVLLIPVCFFYTLIKVKAKTAIKQFRSHLGLKTNFFDYYAHFFSFSLGIIHRTGLLCGKKLKYLTQNEDRIESVLKSGKGVIILSAHIGNFLAAAEILKNRLNTAVNILSVERESEKMRKIYEAADKNSKIKIISLGKNPLDTAFDIKNALQNGEIVAALGDRFIDDNVCELEFLGEKAKFPRGIFEIAAVTQTPIIPVFVVRQNIERYFFRAGDIIETESGDRRKRAEFIDKAMSCFVKQIEEQARKTPLQWYNFYCFW